MSTQTIELEGFEIEIASELAIAAETIATTMIFRPTTFIGVPPLDCVSDSFLDSAIVHESGAMHFNSVPNSY